MFTCGLVRRTVRAGQRWADAVDRWQDQDPARSQMRPIYRKLDATSRHQAVTRARELELIDR